MNIIFKPIVFAIILFFACSCFSENKEIKEHQNVKEKKEFLNHEILNDSIHYKIKEYDIKNYVYRNICVFNMDKLLGEELIYKVQKQEILDEGYNTSTKKTYEIKKQNLLEITDYTFHYYDYDIEDIDTLITLIEIAPNGNIMSKNN